MKQVYDFLAQLKENNNREWFNTHKEEYKRVQAIFNDFTQQLISRIEVWDQQISDSALTVKDCTYRIYRDTRFSKNKTPYKTHMGAYICRGGKKSPYAGYYFHLEPAAANAVFADSFADTAVSVVAPSGSPADGVAISPGYLPDSTPGSLSSIPGNSLHSVAASSDSFSDGVAISPGYLPDSTPGSLSSIPGNSLHSVVAPFGSPADGVAISPGNASDGFLGRSLLAGGLYCPEPKVIASLRDEISVNGDTFLDAIALAKGFKLEDFDTLKRLPRGFEYAEERWHNLLKHKDFSIAAPLPQELLFGNREALLDYASERFRTCYEFNRLLNLAVDFALEDL